MNYSSKIQQQTEALKALNWDVEKLQKNLAAKKPSAVNKADNESLEAEIRRLSELLATQIQTVLAEKKDAEGKDKRIAELNKTLEELRQRESLAFLLNQVHPAAQPLLEADETFRNSFIESKDCTGFVLSVDIRRSTDLMLKARSPEQFATFIGDLTSQLTEVVLESFGVFDKFTGDGILAFFPDFYSGEDAGFHALTVAKRCHEVFEKHYREYRSAFTSIIQDTGLGIGVDFGRLHLVQVAGAITVVGSPVVYACRMGGAPAGITLLNQPAFEVLSDKYGLYFSFTETSLDFKHEGKTLAYAVSPSSKTYIPEAPEWFKVHSDETGTKTLK